LIKLTALGVAMDFTVDCSCGRKIRVETADAGGTKRCLCGTTNAVPALSELRRRAGQPSYSVSIADKLQYMFANGELPPDHACAQCGAETSDVIHCSVECERPLTTGRGYWETVLLGLFSPIAFLGLLSQESKDPEVVGQELIVKTPLPLCSKCTFAVQPTRYNVRELLRGVPLYNQLLRKYPGAELHVLSQVADE
jgi:hypothetical protein